MGYTPHVLVAGGGIVGTAIARDLAIRGLDVTLVERGMLTSGVTGRDGGLLESGARFVQSDPQTAKRCAIESKRVSEIASHYVTDTGGLLVAQASDDAEQLEEFKTACEKVGIETTELAETDLHEKEPALSDDIERALSVPDATVNPQLLTVATARSAQQHGAKIRTQTELTAIHLSDGALDYVELTSDSTVTGRPGRSVSADDDEDGSDAESEGESGDEGESEDEEESEDGGEGEESGDERESEEENKDDGANDPDDTQEEDGEPVPDGGQEHLISHKGKTLPGSGGTNTAEKEDPPARETEELAVDYLINAGGAWAGDIVALADLSVPLETVDDARVVLDDAPTDQPVSPITAVESAQLVPQGDSCLVKHAAIGETNPDASASADRTGKGDGRNEWDLVSPESVDAVLDAFESLVPDLTAATPTRSARGRRYTVAGHGRPRNDHDFVRIDHGKQHDCWGLMTVLGGSLTTHRLLAERVVDAVCTEFGISRPCQTADLPLPGCEPGETETQSKPNLPEPVVDASSLRLGSRTRSVLSGKPPTQILCPESGLTRAEAQDTFTEGDQFDVLDVCVRTGCDSAFWTADGCLDALTAERYPSNDPLVVDGLLVDVLEQYWPETRAVAWERRLTAIAQTQQVQAGWLNRRQPTPAEPDETTDTPDGFTGDSIAEFDTGIESRRDEREQYSVRQTGQWTTGERLPSQELSFDTGGDTQ